MEQIQLTMTISEIIQNYPETREVFINNGFAIFADDTVIRQLGVVLKLKTALKSKNINEDSFMKLLQGKIAETGRYKNLQTTLLENNSNHLNMLSLLPCPLKVPMQGELKIFLDYLREEKNLPLNYCIESFFNDHLDYEDYLEHFEEPDEIPDIIMTAGYGFFYKKFMDCFVAKGIFADVINRPVNSRLAEAGIIDPDGHFTVIGANVLVMVVDKNRLGSTPIPKNWGDLLKPEYENKVVMRGHGDIFCDVVQLNYYKEYGVAGIEQLGRSVRYGLHPAQMVKELTSSRKDVPPIHIMPYFFYKTMKESDHINILWPEDGVLIYPISVLIKADKMQELQELAEYLTGPDIARICAEAYFPATHGDVQVNLPEHVKLKWLGWDFIKNNDMKYLVETMNDTFMRVYRKGGKKVCS
ncbi:ABC transporter substrate-binding protein [Pelosinus propionicus]|uniref:ABC-type Fe3+ transport system, substrate-binding protein n=1 Tax=Pelosinus propionicus DSM 13327 TaxID=1123291 RepID=A0A1I4MTG1_9FIRM|nr:ABC transporter substrate-binding protein [Pelosinus propionicus]SFM06346.1 ABC-type Fe3+ transport system, substrate-binding protein [Pelosinus propionicus DSM 13327]